MINTETKLFSIIGYPIKHSFSPIMQNKWFEREKLNCKYIPFEVDSKNLKKTIDAFKTLGFYGINITIPYKTSVMKYLDHTDIAAKAIGSVNTVIIKNGKLYGYNTDHSGFSSDIVSKNIKLKNKKVFIYGAGGAARAIIYAVKNAGAKEIYLANRTFSKASKLAAEFKINEVKNQDIAKVLADVDLIINTSACGMNPKDKIPFKTKAFKEKAIIYDLIYNKITPFKKLADKNKLQYFSGEGMLINQGAHGFKLWTGIYPDTKSAMRLFKRFSR